MAGSSSGSEFFVSGNCSQCSKVGMKVYHCTPTLAGRGRHHYGNFPGLPLHPQVTTRSPGQCGPTTHPQLFSSFPVRLDSVCNCSGCRTTSEIADRRVPLTHAHPHMAASGCWINPVHSTNHTTFITNPLQSQPSVPPRHVGIGTIRPMDSLQLSGMSALSYHHHHHFHHYHYHHHGQSRNHLHPYALPVVHSRFRRQAGTQQRTSRQTEEHGIPHDFIPILSTESRVAWEGSLDSEQLENVVNFGELVVDQKPKGISKSVLENLPTYRLTSKNQTGESRCVICLMDFEQKQQVRILPCHHEYHSKCIDKWLKSNRSCPICRKEIKIS